MRLLLIIVFSLISISLYQQDLTISETLKYLDKTISNPAYEKNDAGFVTKYDYEFDYRDNGRIIITEHTFRNWFGVPKNYISKKIEFFIEDLDIDRSREDNYDSNPWDYAIKLFPKNGEVFKLTELDDKGTTSIKNISNSYEFLYTYNTHKRDNIFNAFDHLSDLISSEVISEKVEDPFEFKTVDSDLSNKSKQSNVISLIPKEGGVYEIPVIINGVLKISFILDSGAAGITLSSDVALTLMRTGSINQADFLEPQKFILADGTVVENDVVNLKSIEIGDKKIENISASISPNIEAPILIGTSVLESLGKITIDYKRGILIIK